MNNVTVWIDNALPYDSIPDDDTLSFDFSRVLTISTALIQ